MSAGCGVVWEWQPPGVIELRHVCGSHDDDGAHVCSTLGCNCWVSDSGLQLYGRTI